MPDDPNQYHRRSIRLEEFDYSSPGVYFVTVVTRGYKCIFGKIIDKEMHIYELGKIVQDCWQEIPVHFSHIDVEPFIVMPNHIHGIITIHENVGRGTIMLAHARYRAPTIEKFGKPVIGSIPTIIRTYKAAVSRRVRRELRMVNIWQRNYYEHIIRNQLELEDIADYLLANPENWIVDPETSQ
jgi:REP element-mobilizing transposase RayT